MPRLRFWKPVPKDFCEWNDGIIEKLTHGAQSLLFRLHLNCDDAGRLRGNPAWVKSKCFPMADHVSTEQVRAWIAEAADPKIALLLWYQRGGEQYIQLADYQPAKPSQARVDYPGPEQDLRTGEMPMFHVEHPEPDHKVSEKITNAQTNLVRSEPSTVISEPIFSDPVCYKTETDTENQIRRRPIPNPVAGAEAVAYTQGGAVAERIVGVTEIRDEIARDAEAGRRLWADAILDRLKPLQEHSDGDYRDLGILSLAIAKRPNWVSLLIDTLITAEQCRLEELGFGAWRNKMRDTFGEWRRPRAKATT